jgi:S1-C subfamily serine protease
VINVITEVNGEPVDGVASFERIAGAAPSGSRLRIYVRRFFRSQERQPVYVFPPVP